MSDAHGWLAARLSAWDEYERTRKAHEAAAASFRAVMAVCPGACPADWAGHWRDWHRGHGCEMDIRGNLFEYRRALDGLEPEAKEVPRAMTREEADAVEEIESAMFNAPPAGCRGCARIAAIVADLSEEWGRVDTVARVAALDWLHARISPEEKEVPE